MLYTHMYRPYVDIRERFLAILSCFASCLTCSMVWAFLGVYYWVLRLLNVRCSKNMGFKEKYSYQALKIYLISLTYFNLIGFSPFLLILLPCPYQNTVWFRRRSANSSREKPSLCIAPKKNKTSTINITS